MELIDDDVLVVLSTLDIDKNSVKIGGQLDRKLYLAVNKVLDRIGGRWNRKVKAHVFDDDPTGRLNDIIECGVLDPKVSTGYFPTPPEIVDKMIELADLGANQQILEPSAGQGHIADRVVNHLKNLQVPTINVRVCENLPENIHVLEANGWTVERDFFEFVSYCVLNNIKFDRILMNPPFEFQSDIHHVATAFNILAPDGILVAIMSSGATFGENKKSIEFREKIMEPHQTYLESLPSGAFKESGTMVRTIMLRLEKVS